MRIAARTGSTPWQLTMPLGMVRDDCGCARGRDVSRAQKRFFDSDQLLSMTRHFTWLFPLAYLLVFVLVGLVGSAAVFSALGRSLGDCATLFAARPSCPCCWWPLRKFIAWPGSSSPMGLSARLVPVVERQRKPPSIASWLYGSPILALTLVALTATLGPDGLKQRREQMTADLPDAPNIVLIVMDTVAAAHLDLYGYAPRPGRNRRTGPGGAAGSTPRSRPLRGPFPRMRACSPGYC